MGALDQLKILDFSTLLPGPYATLMLADLGADVLSVVAPNRYDLVAHWPPIIQEVNLSTASAWLGRNKKSIQIDLKTAKGNEIVKKLITAKENGGMGYDIILEQFRPGVMKSLGLDYDTLCEINPALIYCSLTGYGQTGTLSSRAGHDINYLARSGNMACAGKTETGPSLTNMQIADVAVGSMNSVIGILSSVIYRNATGKGQYIDIAMLDGLIPFNSMDGISYLSGGIQPQREQQMLNGGGIYDFYETKDHLYMSVGALEPKFFKNLCIALGFPELQNGKILKTEPQKVKDIFIETFKTKTQKEWIDVFKDFDACVEPVLSIEDICLDEHIKIRELLPEVKIPETDQVIQQFGCPIKLSKCPPKYKHTGYSAGYHTKSILKSLGMEND